ncbi:MAG: phage major capsid protein [Tannerellaceae bacterium]
MTPEELQRLFDAMVVKRNRITEIDDLIRAENRTMSEDEAKEFEHLNANLTVMQRKLEAWQNEQKPLTRAERKAAEAVASVVRSMALGKSPSEMGLKVENNTIYLERAQVESTDVSAIQPDSVHELLEPLQKALLIDRLGVKINTGIVGTRKYPSVTNVEASIEGETTELTGKKITFTAPTATPKRVGISIPFSLLSLHQANIDLIGYAFRLMNQATAQLLNKWMFSTTKLTNASDGCFVEAAKSANAVFTLTDVPLSEEHLVDMETKVLNTNITNDGTAAYVCGVKAYGEVKKMRDPISGEKIFQNGLLNGYPVLVSNHIESTEAGVLGIGFGIFSNVELNQYGAVNIVVDTVSRSKEAITEVNFNGFYDIEVVRKEAFAYGTFKKSTRPANTVTVDGIVKTKEQV